MDGSIRLAGMRCILLGPTFTPNKYCLSLNGALHIEEFILGFTQTILEFNKMFFQGKNTLEFLRGFLQNFPQEFFQDFPSGISSKIHPGAPRALLEFLQKLF